MLRRLARAFTGSNKSRHFLLGKQTSTVLRKHSPSCDDGMPEYECRNRNSFQRGSALDQRLRISIGTQDNVRGELGIHRTSL